MPTYPYARRLTEQQATFAGQMRALASDLRSGTLTLDQWAYRSQVAIQSHVLDGYRLGVARARGLAPSKVRLTVAERHQANEMIVRQFEYLAKFKEALKARMAMGGSLTSALDARATLYSGGMRDAYGYAQVRENPDQMLTWHRHARDSCSTCIGNNGVRKSAREWEQGGVWPAHGTACMSACRCSLG